MKKIKSLFLIIISCLFVFSCSKKETEEMSDLDKIKHHNKTSYPSIKMDSAQAINNITKQKIQELLDLSAIYASGNRNTGVDSLIYNQINSYFLSPDSIKTKPLIAELDSLRVKNIRVINLDIDKQITDKDTLNIANFTVEYITKDRKSIGFFDKKASYILKKSPVKFVKEFKFYFIDFDIKDSASVGVTK